MKFTLHIFSIIFLTIRAESDVSSSEELTSSAGNNRNDFERKIVCDSTSISITAHVNDLYNNLPEHRWDDVRLIIGTCNGTATHELGWITETFELGSCGGEFTQNDDNIIDNTVSVGWNVCGARELALWRNLIISSKRGFNAKCSYKNVVTVSTEFKVRVNCNNITSSESVVVIDSEGTGSFDDLFALNLYKDSSKTILAEEITIGEKSIIDILLISVFKGDLVYGFISSDQKTAFKYNYQVKLYFIDPSIFCFKVVKMHSASKL